MDSLIKIGFAGSDKCDLLLYMSRIALCLHKKIAIVDASKEQLLSYSIPNPLRNAVVTYRDVDVFLKCDNYEEYQKVQFDKYDIALIDYGFNGKLASEVKKDNLIVLVSDFEKPNIQGLKDFLRGYSAQKSMSGGESELQNKIKAIKLFRNIVNFKINTDYISNLLETNDLMELVVEYNIYYDERDYICKIGSQYNDYFKFAKLSKPYKNMLYDLFKNYLGFNDKEIKKAMRKAERGL